MGAEGGIRMTLDEAISYEKRNIEINELIGEVSDCEPTNAIDYHRQLVEWLKELKQLREQEPKTGHWILFDECSNSGYYCSECRKKVIKEGWSNTVKKIKYCPNCGTKMLKLQESEE